MIEMAGSKKEKEASSERGCLKTKAENAIKKSPFTLQSRGVSDSYVKKRKFSLQT
jgi:hypothetical protein